MVTKRFFWGGEGGQHLHINQKGKKIKQYIISYHYLFYISIKIDQIIIYHYIFTYQSKGKKDLSIHYLGSTAIQFLELYVDHRSEGVST